MSDEKKKKPFKYPAPGVQHLESGKKTGKSETGSSAIRGSARRFGLEDTADDDAEPIGMSSGRSLGARQPSEGLNSSRHAASQGLYPRISEVHATGVATSSGRGFGQFGAVAVPDNAASTSEQASLSSTVVPRAMPPSRLLDNRDRRTVEDPASVPEKGGLALLAPGQAPANSSALSRSHSPGLGSQTVVDPTSVSQETTPTNSSRAVARRSDGASQVGAIAVADVGAGVGAPPRSSAETVVAEAVTNDALADDIRNQLREELREEIQRNNAAIPSAEVVQQRESQALAGGAGLDSTSSGGSKAGFWTSKRLWIAATAVLLVAVGALVAALLASGGSGGGDTAATNQDNQGPREVPGPPSSPPVDNPTVFGNPTFVPPSPSLPPSSAESPANLPTQPPAADFPTSTGAPMSPTSSPVQFPVDPPTLQPAPFPTPSPVTRPTDPPTLQPATLSPTPPLTPDPTPPPTPDPTPLPTPDPTPRPTDPPALQPTTPPPTPRPTPRPTPDPTRQPTPFPTPPPTRDPTPRPTPRPTTPRPTTPRPTPFPTRNPTPAPTRNPTPAPTRQPTPAPTRNPTPSPTEGAQSCPTFFDPVCGSNGRTYGNACEANVAGVSIDCNQSCPCPAGCKDKYGNGIDVCSETSSKCRFYIALNGQSCDGYCEGRGGSCIAAFDDINNGCVNNPTSSTCNEEATDQLCECTL